MNSSSFFSTPYLALLAAASVYALVIAWAYRKGPKRLEIADWSIYETAFLLGGPVRVIEIALFRLVRDSYVRFDEKGLFTSRFEEVPEELGPVERGVLSELIKAGGLPAARIVFLELPAMEKVERSLVRKGAVISHREWKQLRWLALFPLEILLVAGVGRLAQLWIRGEREWLLALVLSMTLVFVARLRKKLTHRTLAGEKLEKELREKALERPTPQSRPVSDRDFDPYNPLQDLESRILHGGLRALAGTAFAPFSAFYEGKNARLP